MDRRVKQEGWQTRSSFQGNRQTQISWVKKASQDLQKRNEARRHILKHNIKSYQAYVLKHNLKTYLKYIIFTKKIAEVKEIFNVRPRRTKRIFLEEQRAAVSKRIKESWRRRNEQKIR